MLCSFQLLPLVREKSDNENKALLYTCIPKNPLTSVLQISSSLTQTTTHLVANGDTCLYARLNVRSNENFPILFLSETL